MGDDDNEAPESFVFFGTQQPLDVGQIKSKERNKFLPVHLQEVISFRNPLPWPPNVFRSVMSEDGSDCMGPLRAASQQDTSTPWAQKKVGLHQTAPTALANG
jgi:hypothetical protein